VLQLDEDLEFERRSWRAQRVGWLVIVLLLVAAALGFFGSGPFSKRSAAIPGLMRVEYQRFGRYQTPETLTIRLEPQATAGGVVRLGIARRFLNHSKVESIVPAPDRVEASDNRLVYVFPLVQPGLPLVVMFRLQPEQFGSIRGRITLPAGPDPADAGPSIGFRQFVYP
jgi:hypothetical protein